MQESSPLSEEQREAAVALFATVRVQGRSEQAWGWAGKLSSGCTTVE